MIGKWLGALNPEIHIYYEISRKLDGSLMGYNGIVELKLSGGPVEVVTLDRDTVRFEELESNQRYVGTLDREPLTIQGEYSNLNISNSWPLVLQRVDSLPLPPRPQTPQKPYPYDEEELVYRNAAAAIHIAGTLTLPRGRGPWPAVLLITGSGQQNRDEELAFHRPFLVLADYLTRRGIAVLRVDDRGVGGTTRLGPFFDSTTKDFVSDASAGVRYLKARKEIHPKKIGLIGHSEGGLIASMLAAETRDAAFIVLLASPAGGPLREGILEQDKQGARAKGATEAETATIIKWCTEFYELALTEKNRELAQEQLQRLYDERTQEEKAAFEKTGLSGGTLRIDYALTPHFRGLMALNPDEFLRRVQCPVLALMGGEDTSGPSKSSLAAIEKALIAGTNRNYRVQELRNLNHHFQTVDPKNLQSAGDIQETFSPVALEIIGTWIEEQSQRR
ncbi:MAG: alpha/beta hydrolase family protein [Verrucomicrobiia bacterium]